MNRKKRIAKYLVISLLFSLLLIFFCSCGEKNKFHWLDEEAETKSVSLTSGDLMPLNLSEDSQIIYCGEKYILYLMGESGDGAYMTDPVLWRYDFDIDSQSNIQIVQLKGRILPEVESTVVIDDKMYLSSENGGGDRKNEILQTDLSSKEIKPVYQWQGDCKKVSLYETDGRLMIYHADYVSEKEVHSVVDLLDTKSGQTLTIADERSDASGGRCVLEAAAKGYEIALFTAEFDQENVAYLIETFDSDGKIKKRHENIHYDRSGVDTTSFAKVRFPFDFAKGVYLFKISDDSSYIEYQIWRENDKGIYLTAELTSNREELFFHVLSRANEPVFYFGDIKEGGQTFLVLDPKNQTECHVKLPDSHENCLHEFYLMPDGSLLVRDTDPWNRLEGPAYFIDRTKFRQE